MRALEQLIDTRDPGLPLVREWIAGATRPAELLPCDPADGARALLALQVTTRSPMGALAHASGGLLIDQGWLRVLGAGCPRLPRALDTFNGMGGARRFPPGLLVADDAVGGFFAISEGGDLGKPGGMAYLAPDTLSWDALDVSYSEFLVWALQGDGLTDFYRSSRWPGWEDEVRALPGDRVVSFYPPLFAAAESLVARSRATIPVEEAWTLHAVELPQQVGPLSRASRTAPAEPGSGLTGWLGRLFGRRPKT